LDAQAAGEESIAIGIVQENARPHTSRDKRTGHHFGEQVDVFARVTDNRGFAGSAAAGMHANGLLARHSQQTKGVMILQILLAGEWKFWQVFDGANIARLEAQASEHLLVERYALRNVGDHVA